MLQPLYCTHFADKICYFNHSIICGLVAVPLIQALAWYQMMCLPCLRVCCNSFEERVDCNISHNIHVLTQLMCCQNNSLWLITNTGFLKPSTRLLMIGREWTNLHACIYNVNLFWVSCLFFQCFDCYDMLQFSSSQCSSIKINILLISCYKHSCLLCHYSKILSILTLENIWLAQACDVSTLILELLQVF